MYDNVMDSKSMPIHIKEALTKHSESTQWVFIGSDFSGQENVNLSHYLYPIDGGNLDNVINLGTKEAGTDLHSLNAKVCGVSRDDAKALFFGKLYGSSPTLTGFTILGDKPYTDYTQQEFDAMEKKLSKRTVEIAANPGVKYYPIKKGQLVIFNDKLIIQAIFGMHIQAKLTDNTIGLTELEEGMQEEVKKNGYITLAFDRRIYVDSPHKSLNFNCQGLGGMAFKIYLRIFYNTLESMGIHIGPHYRLQACIYDEIDIIAHPDYADRIIDVMNSSYAKTSEELELRVTYSGETLLGTNWAECH